MEETRKQKVKKVGGILLNVLLIIFLVLCLFALVLTLLGRNGSDKTAEIFGYQMRIVTSDSMEECEYTDVSAYKIKDIPVRSMVFIQTVPDDPAEAEEWYRSLTVGDVLTFRYVYTTQVTITHRIISIEEKTDGGFVIELAGDNKTAPDGQLTQRIDTSVVGNANYVIGKVTGKAYLFGALMSFLMTPAGIVVAIIVPCFLIILWEALRIAKVLSADKKEKEQKEEQKKDDELEELRKRLAELEKDPQEETEETEDKSE